MENRGVIGMSRLEVNEHNYRLQAEVNALYKESVQLISEGRYEDAQCIFDEMEEIQAQYIM